MGKGILQLRKVDRQAPTRRGKKKEGEERKKTDAMRCPQAEKKITVHRN